MGQHSYYSPRKNGISRIFYNIFSQRSALDNTIVTTTGASKAIGLILEDLKNKVVGDAARVPILSSSLLKLYMK